MIIHVFMVLEELSCQKLGEKLTQADNVDTCRYSRLEMTVRKQDSSYSSTGARARSARGVYTFACAHSRHTRKYGGAHDSQSGNISYYLNKSPKQRMTGH